MSPDPGCKQLWPGAGLKASKSQRPAVCGVQGAPLFTAPKSGVKRTAAVCVYVFTVVAARANGARTSVRRGVGSEGGIGILRARLCVLTFLRDKSRAPGSRRFGDMIEENPVTAQVRHGLGEAIKIDRLDDVATDPKLVAIHHVPLLL